MYLEVSKLGDLGIHPCGVIASHLSLNQIAVRTPDEGTLKAVLLTCCGSSPVSFCKAHLVLGVAYWICECPADYKVTIGG